MIDIKRRELLLGFIAVGAGLAVTSGFSSTDNRKSLKIQILGGTGFIGPRIVCQAPVT